MLGQLLAITNGGRLEKVDSEQIFKILFRDVPLIKPHKSSLAPNVFIRESINIY